MIRRGKSRLNANRTESLWQSIFFHLFVNSQQRYRDDKFGDCRRRLRLAVIIVIDWLLGTRRCSIVINEVQADACVARTVTARLCIRGHFTKATVRFHRARPVSRSLFAIVFVRTVSTRLIKSTQLALLLRLARALFLFPLSDFISVWNCRRLQKFAPVGTLSLSLSS